MTTPKQIEIAEHIKNTGLVTQIFHSVILLKDEQRGTMFPAYKKGAEFVYSGIDDTKGMFAYIRENGDITASPLKIASCAKSYTVIAPLRVVFFHDQDKRDFGVLTTKLSSFTYLQNVSLVKIITDRWRLVQEESPLFRERFDGKTFYIAFDITVKFELTANDCEVDDCVIYINPIKCPAVVHESMQSAS